MKLCVAENSPVLSVVKNQKPTVHNCAQMHLHQSPHTEYYTCQITAKIMFPICRNEGKRIN